MALQQQASAKLCGVVLGMEHGTFAEGTTYSRQSGHHVWHRTNILVVNITVIITTIRPHHSTTYIDVVYCYRQSSVV